jgi:hypothetical protein
MNSLLSSRWHGDELENENSASASSIDLRLAKLQKQSSAPQASKLPCHLDTGFKAKMSFYSRGLSTFIIYKCSSNRRNAKKSASNFPPDISLIKNIFSLSSDFIYYFFN